MGYLHPEMLLFIGLAGIPIILLNRYSSLRNMDRGFHFILAGSLFLSIAMATEYLDAYVFRNYLGLSFQAPSFQTYVAIFGYFPGIIFTVLGVGYWFALTARLEDDGVRRFDVEQQLVAKAEELRAVVLEADAANRAKSDFLANMSHELRTPLNAIIGFSELMQTKSFGALDSRQYDEYSGLIHGCGKNLLDIVNDMLDLARIEAGQMQLQEADINLGQAIESGLRLTSGVLEKKGLSLVTTISQNLGIYADERLVQQMVFNLVSNAAKFTQRDGVVTVAVFSMPNGGNAFIVKDTGCGMTEAEVARVVKPFTQLEGAMTRSHEGIGLGLTLVKTFIELHGGKMLLESRKDIGTSVCITFPPSRTVGVNSYEVSLQDAG